MGFLSIVTDKYSQPQWNALVESFADMNFLHLWEYAAARARAANFEVCRLQYEDRDGRGAAQGYIRTIAGKGAIVITRPLGYVPHQALHDEFVGKRKLCLFVNHAWTSARLDLSASCERLESGLRKNWRHALHKARESELITGVTVKLDGPYPAYYPSTVTTGFMRAFQRFATERHRLRVFSALHQGISLGTLITAQYANTCEYLAARISDAGRRLNAGQLLLWEALLWAKCSGYSSFDVGGLSNSLPGINYFKEGLNGNKYIATQANYEAYPDTLVDRVIRQGVRHVLRQLAV